MKTMKRKPKLTEEMKEQAVGLTKAIAAVIDRASEMEMGPDIILPVISNIIVDMAMEGAGVDKQVFLNYLDKVWEIKNELNKNEEK